MAEFDPDAFLAEAPKSGGAFDPDAFLRGEKAPPTWGQTLTSHLPAAITDIPHEIYQSGAGALHEMNAVNPWGAERTEARARNEPPSLTAVPRALMGAAALPFAPITGAVHSVGGHLLEMLNSGMRAGAVKLYGEDRVRQAEAAQGLHVGGEGYEESKGVADKLMMGMGPRGGMRPAAVPMPAPPAADALGVMLSEGQRTGQLPAIRREQAAARGQMGPAAEAQAKAFLDEQQGQVAGAAENVRGALDPFGQVVAETPQEAGQVVSQSIQGEAAARKAAVDAAYERARGLPGEISADTFEGMGARIRDDLSGRAEPVVIDDKLTPYASQAIQDIDNRVAQLRIQNRASNTRTMMPGDEQPTIAGVTLNGVDQMRKRLSAFRQQAFGSGNASDGRAVKSVLDSFDAAVDHAINNGQFTGDARAVQAWNDARAAHADYRSTFTAQKNDPIGRVIEKITGKNNNPAAIPNDVADFLYGSSGTNPNSLNVGVANRVKSILGDRSPEWSAVKQGLFSRLTETPPGVTDWGPGRIAQRLNKFLNGDGRELADAMFSPAERNLLQQYADLHRKLEVPPTGANRSETSTFVAPILRKIGSKLGMVVGGVIGGGIGHTLGIPFAGEAIGAGTAAASGALANAKAARQIATQMPLVAERMARYQRALAAAQKANTPISNRAAGVALASLSKSLQPLGIDVYQLAPAKADENQRQRGGRLEHKPDQGEGGKAHRADGGDVAERAADRDALPDHAFHQTDVQVTQPSAPPSVFDQAITQYPILQRSGVAGTISPDMDNGNDPLHGGGYLEFWGPGNGGGAQYPRPESLPMDSPGVEIRSAKTRPIDVLGDVVSHHLVNTDPKIKSYYQQFTDSLTGDQKERLQDQYKYAQQNLGETRSFKEWADVSGLPGYFRGYAFQQWPADFNARAYTPQQRKMFDEMMQYLSAPAAPQRALGGRVDANNIDHAPTEAQKKAGNYAKDHVHIHGLDITIENAKGAMRSGVDRGGKPWSVKMPAHYGYIKGTVGKDKDHVDVYVGPHLKSPRVFVVDQNDADTGKFDEHKAFVGFVDRKQVDRAYSAAFSDGRAKDRLGHVAEMSVDEFKHWLENGDTTKPAEHANGGAVAFKDNSPIGLAQNAPGVHFQCRTCKFDDNGTCRNPNPKLDGRKIKPHWCCNLYDHEGMKVIV